MSSNCLSDPSSCHAAFMTISFQNQNWTFACQCQISYECIQRTGLQPVRFLMEFLSRFHAFDSNRNGRLHLKVAESFPLAQSSQKIANRDK